MSLLAPALRIDDFDSRLGKLVISEQHARARRPI